jgi:hypothetical protein
MKHCNKCSTDKQENEFYMDYSTGRRKSICKSCEKLRRKVNYRKNPMSAIKRAILYSKTDKGRESARRANAKARVVHKDKYAARTKLRIYVRNGQILRMPCEICGETKVQAHHYLGYEGDHWKDVKWLCGKHHRMVHKGEVSI